MAPMSIVAGFQFLPPTPAQRASHHTMPEGDSTLEYPLGSGPGFPASRGSDGGHRDRWSTTSSLVFPSMDPLAMPAWDEEREVKVPQPEASYTDNAFRFHSGPQHDQLESVRHHPSSTYHTPFHFSTNIPVQPQYPEANINGDAAVTWDMNTDLWSKAGQIDGQVFIL
jgi:hypothetical protein